MPTFEIRKLRVITDARGCLFEPMSAEDLRHQQNVHAVITQPGQIRGNHRHARATEWLTVLGPACVRVRVDGAIADHAVPAGEAWRFLLPPGVAHAIENTGTTPGLVLSFSDAVHDPERPDTIREELIPAPSPVS
jgi:UDP-2-acetamido-2,6-beta-L-arabino-hexul-4-ose reductase